MPRGKYLGLVILVLELVLEERVDGVAGQPSSEGGGDAGELGNEGCEQLSKDGPSGKGGSREKKTV
eukprot:765983-Hanusia_phi.AAC.3